MRLALAFLAGLSLPAQAQEAYTLPADEAQARFVASNLISVFYHELGHALIDVLLLPVLGREEDAADTLSALMINGFWEEEGATALVYDTALAFRLFSERSEREGWEATYWGQHSLDMQRYYNLVCLFVGAEPALRDDIARELELPEERLEQCPDEFAMAFDSWGALLADMPPQDGGRGLRLVVPEDRDDYTAIIAEEVRALNSEYGLPQWIDVTVERCGEANAFYDPRAKRIVMCLEYAEDLESLWLEGQLNP